MRDAGTTARGGAGGAASSSSSPIMRTSRPWAKRGPGPDEYTPQPPFRFPAAKLTGIVGRRQRARSPARGGRCLRHGCELEVVAVVGGLGAVHRLPRARCFRSVRSDRSCRSVRSAPRRRCCRSARSASMGSALSAASRDSVMSAAQSGSVMGKQGGPDQRRGVGVGALLVLLFARGRRATTA